MPLIFAYLEAIQCDPETWEQMRLYMDLIRRRASGQLVTAARWMREKVASHPLYKRDSVVPAEVAYDLVAACAAVAEGRLREPTLLGKNWIPPLRCASTENSLNSHHDTHAVCHTTFQDG